MTQPTLPAEGQTTDLEQYFISEQPKRLWPTNQNSNLGAIRRVLTDPLQECVDVLSEIINEMFVDTADGYLGLWEDEVGLPKNPSGLALIKRRSLVLGRLTKQPFTKARRQAVVEQFISSTFGPATEITPAGIPITAGGITLYSGANSLTGLYTITEDIDSFHYSVLIDASIGVDTTLMARELSMITPAGITFDISTTATPTPLTYGAGTYGSGTYGGT